MTLNPFIEFARDPVGVLAWLGYALFLVTVVVIALPWSVRKSAWLIARYQQNRASDSWWSFGDRNAGYIPPQGWLLHAASVCLVLAVSAWAVGALIWLVGV
jgi:hypothetical protein